VTMPVIVLADAFDADGLLKLWHAGPGCV
jgi:hypothetical protein